MKSICSIFVIVSLASLARAIDKPAIDRIVMPAMDGKWCDALVVGVIDEHGQQTFAYNAKEDAIFEIGSSTKVFTSLALAEMVQKNEVALDEAIDKYLPAGVTAPKFKDKTFTLGQLATHTSGLPRLPDNFEPKDPHNPYADYDLAHLNKFLSHYKLPRAPGETIEYSNVGTGLLGEVLAQRAKKTYEQLIVDGMCDPLKMTDTRVSLSAAQKSRLVTGHTADGDVESNWDFNVLAGCGAIKSDAKDLLQFLAANISPPAGELGDAIKLTHRKRGVADVMNDIALGWHIAKRTGVVWHDGQTGGYASFMGFQPEKKIGVVVLSNTSTTLVDQFAVSIVRQMLGEPPEPPKLRQTVKIDPKLLDDFVGDYALTPLFKVSITRKDQQLYAQATGQPPFRIYPESDAKFFYKVVDAQLTFERGDDGKIQRLFLDQNGQHLPGPRVK